MSADWWRRINTADGLTAEQLRHLIEELAGKVDPHSSGDWWGGLSEGCDLALDLIADIKGLAPVDPQ